MQLWTHRGPYSISGIHNYISESLIIHLYLIIYIYQIYSYIPFHTLQVCLGSSDPLALRCSEKTLRCLFLCRSTLHGRHGAGWHGFSRGSVRYHQIPIRTLIQYQFIHIHTNSTKSWQSTSKQFRVIQIYSINFNYISPTECKTRNEFFTFSAACSGSGFWDDSAIANSSPRVEGIGREPGAINMLNSGNT